jgi:hypothetical protein
MFGNDAKLYSCPLDKHDHPEVDETEMLDDNGIKRYQSLIGALQWAITLGRFDIQCAVMTMGRFRAAPRKGHLERLKRIIGYLRHYPDATVRFRTGIPNHEARGDPPTYDWMHSVYGRSSDEQNPPGMPTPRGKPMRITTFVDANLYHDLTTGRSTSGILHMVNQTPISWFSKCQATVETATYGSEFVAARLATEQIICYVVQPMHVRKTGITRCRQYLVNASGRYYKRPAIHLSGLRDCKTQLAYDAPHGLDSGYEDLC